jgi:hypothetical protein
MRRISTYIAAVCLAFASLVAALLSGHDSVSARFVSDSILARASGTDPGNLGNGSYSCNNVNSTGKGQVTQSECNAYNTTNPPKNLTCVNCMDVSGTGLLTNGQGGKIVYTTQFSCSIAGQNGVNTSRMETSPCELNSSGQGTCVIWTVSNTPCSGSFYQWLAQGSPGGQ